MIKMKRNHKCIWIETSISAPSCLVPILISTSIELLVLVVWHHISCGCRLILERMGFAVGKEHRVRAVLVIMRECAVSLGDVEAENTKGDRADQLLLEGALLLIRDLVSTYRSRWKMINTTVAVAWDMTYPF